MRAEGLAVVLLGCYHPTPPGAVPCASNGACPDGLVCDTAASPPACVDHLPGTQDAAIDAAAPDGTTADAPPDAFVPPQFVAQAYTSGAAVTSVRYSLTVPPGSGRFLIVTVQLGSMCAGTVPDVTSVAYDGVPLARITSITGTPCGMTTTRSDQWQLIAPAVGAHDVAVVLAGSALTVHSGALAFAGIDQTTPVRATAIARGAGTASTVTVNTAPGDLVVDTVGQGSKILAPGAGQTQRFLDNISGSDTLDNAAASTAIATGPTATMIWTFAASDEWQTIATSLQP